MNDLRADETVDFKDLKEAFLGWLIDGGKSRNVFTGMSDMCPIDSVLDRLAESDEQLPSWACFELGMPMGSTYREAVHRLRK